MKRDLRGSKKQNASQPPPQQYAEIAQNVMNSNPEAFGNVQNIVNHYGGKSEAELLGELKGFRESGIMDPAALQSVAQKIAPMLTPEQQQRLFGVMQQLQ